MKLNKKKRPPRPWLCKICGDTDPVNFYDKSKSRCKACELKVMKEKRDERNKKKEQGVEVDKTTGNISKEDREKWHQDSIAEIRNNLKLKRELLYGV